MIFTYQHALPQIQYEYEVPTTISKGPFNPFSCKSTSEQKSVRFHDTKLKFVKALSFRLFHEASTASYCVRFICGRAYL